jgi:hypothetical protein
MSAVKQCFSAVVRWGWFGLLVSLAFAYLAAGLSQLGPPHERTDADLTSETQQEPEQQNDTDAKASAQDEDLAQALHEVNQLRREALEQRSLQSADMADWLTVCRRVSLALVGNGLSVEEIRQLEQVPEGLRVQVHLDNLLNDPRYHHYWGERWARFLVGTDNGQFITYRRRRFRIWLTEVFASNRRYDDMVRDLIVAEGLWTDRPEVNFLTATFDSNDGRADPIRLAARTSRAFLGLRIDCLQCHNDFLGNVNLGDVDQPREGLQSDFHQLAAFYTSAKTSGLQGVREGDADYKYKYLNATDEVAVEPAVPFYPELLPAEGSPRQRLAAWVTHPENHQAARAAVSHVWALMFGRAAGEAVDNLPLDESSSPILEAMAVDFVSHRFDMRRLIRLIAQSEAFRVESRAESEITAEHERHHAVFPLVRLRPEQVAGSIIQSARIKKTDRESSLFLQLQTLTGTNDFVTRYGDIGEDEFSTDSVTITQRLMMMNGNLLRELININPVLNASAHINMFAGDDEQAVEIAFLSALNRYPTEAERQRFAERLKESNRRENAIEDMFWVLLNSSELAWNH